MKKITKLLILSMVVLCVICSISITVGAATEYTEGYYTYTVSGGVATITDCDTAISGDITIPTSLGGYPVTAIDNYVFFSMQEYHKCKNTRQYN